jgi:hypothetical protein
MLFGNGMRNRRSSLQFRIGLHGKMRYDATLPLRFTRKLVSPCLESSKYS